MGIEQLYFSILMMHGNVNWICLLFKIYHAAALGILEGEWPEAGQSYLRCGGLPVLGESRKARHRNWNTGSRSGERK